MIETDAERERRWAAVKELRSRRIAQVRAEQERVRNALLIGFASGALAGLILGMPLALAVFG